MTERVAPTFTQVVARALASAALVLAASPSAIHASTWQPVGTLAVPQFSYSFLAATPSGDVLAATFYSAQPGSPAKAIPALLIRNPNSGAPEVVELCRVPFDNQRGFSGIACDPNGSFFVSGDTGTNSTSFIRKFKSDGSPDPSFGQAGEVLPNRRCLGLDVIGEYLLVAVDWGQIEVRRAMDGGLVGSVGQAAKPFIRDIAIDPKSMRIFGVAEGALYTWGKGAPWNPQGYDFRQLSQKSGELRSGEGVSFDPILRAILNTPIPGNTLLEVFGNGSVNRYTITSASPNAHLADSVMSYDGTTLFVSDMVGQKIHVMKRDMNTIIASRGGSNTTTTTASSPVISKGSDETAPPVKWEKSYTEVVQKARQAGKPMVVYFRSGNFKGCTDFEKNVLLTPAFNARAQNYVNVFEDVSKDRLLATRFGVFRVPHIVVLDAQGETRGELSGNIDTNKLFDLVK